MAGDTAGASRANKARQLQKKRARPIDRTAIRSSDEYYASGQKSTVNPVPSLADGAVTGGDPQPVKKRPRPIDRTAIRSSDEYYAAPAQSPTAQQLAVAGRQVGKTATRTALGPLPPVGHARKPVAQPTGPLSINAKEEIPDVISELAERLQAGATAMVVYVVKEPSEVMRRTRVAFEQLMTKEIITEEMYHEVRFSYPVVTPPVEVPTPTETKRVEENEGVEDPMAFLSADNTDDTVGSVEAVTPMETEVEDNDFLIPEPAAEAEAPVSTLDPGGAGETDIAVSTELDPAAETLPPVAETNGASDETPAAAPTPPRRGRGRKA